MNGDLDLEECFECGNESIPENHYRPYICYSCQWKMLEMDEEKELSKPTLCRTCMMEINHKTARDLQCKPCHFKDRIHEVYPGVFISDCGAATEYEYLESLGIKQILTIAKELKKHEHPKFNSIHISLDDSPDVDIKQHFDQAHGFISTAPTLVHCFAGISRSATLVISYMMKREKLSTFQAIKRCKKIRNVVNPNNGFIKQLIEYAKELNTHKEIVDETFESNTELYWYVSKLLIGPTML